MLNVSLINKNRNINVTQLLCFSLSARLWSSEIFFFFQDFLSVCYCRTHFSHKRAQVHHYHVLLGLKALMFSSRWVLTSPQALNTRYIYVRYVTLLSCLSFGQKKHTISFKGFKQQWRNLIFFSPVLES